MILNTPKFNARVKSAGMKPEDLASEIKRPGVNATSALRNWSKGNFKPAPKREDIRSLAAALSVPVTAIASFEGAHKWAKISARKARLVSDLIRGRDIDTALTMLKFSKKRAAVLVRKALEAAIACAEENDADVSRLVVSESRVDEGPTMKRFQPKDRGRAHPIMKRSSHILVAVEVA